MKNESTSNFKLGIVVTSALALFVVTVYIIGTRQNMFGNTFFISSVFKNVNGLQTGNNVRYAGIDVGIVDEIVITSDSSVQVNMKLNSEVRKFIKKDAFASIGSDGLVGNMLVNISPGSGAQPPVEHLDLISSFSRTDTDDILNTLSSTNENIALLSRDLLAITQHINEGQGTITALLRDSTMAFSLKSSLTNIELATNNSVVIVNKLKTVTDELENEKSLIGFILRDTTFASQMMQVVSQIDASSRHLQSATADLDKASSVLVEGKGPINTLLYDSLVSKDLRESIHHIKESSILLNENMEAMRHNFLFKRYFKKQNKKSNTN